MVQLGFRATLLVATEEDFACRLTSTGRDRAASHPRRSRRRNAGCTRSRPAFRVEEASIADIHEAIQQGRTTCRGVVQAYLDRARAYNGVSNYLVTADGAPTSRSRPARSAPARR